MGQESADERVASDVPKTGANAPAPAALPQVDQDVDHRRTPRQVDETQDDLTDGRAKYEWGSRYKDCRGRIFLEAAYVALLILALPMALVITYLGLPAQWLHLEGPRASVAQHFALVWLAGCLGGTLFTTKWLYHSVANGYWNADRLLWRIFTPPLSAGIAMAVILLVQSRILPILSTEVTASDSGAVAIAIFVGYFSDRAAGRLNELAAKLFGPHQRDKPRKRREKKSETGPGVADEGS